MSQPSNPLTTINLQKHFAASAAKAGRRKKPDKLVPMSFRVTEGERAQIRKDAGKLAISTYIRRRLLGDNAVERQARHTRKQKKPEVDYIALAQLLSKLGQSELATSMCALAIAAKSGCLPVTEELEEKLDSACNDIHDMRIALITALNVKAEDG